MEALRFVLSVFRSVHDLADDLLQNAAAVQDWQEAVAVADRHGLTPLVASRPPFNPADGTVPEDVIETARKTRHRAVIAHAAALAVLSQVDQAFSASGIPYASLKGAGLYESLYKDVAPRRYVDIDLLIARECIPRCLDILETFDYRPACGPLRMALLRRGHFHLPLKSADPRRPPIELHWALVDGMNLYRPRVRDVLARTRPFATARSTFRVLSLEDQWVYLCMHTAKHGLLNDIGLLAGWPAARFCESGTGNRLAWFTDLELFLEKHSDALDWEVTANRIEEWNAGEAVQQSLRVLSVLQPTSPAEATLVRLEAVCRDPDRDAEDTARHRRSADIMLRIAQRSGGMSETFLFRPVRFLGLGGILFPGKHRIQRYYREHRPALLPWLYLTHPFRLIARTLFPSDQ